jgi:hypothetical protein
MRRTTSPSLSRFGALLAVSVIMVGCGKHYLDRYSFSGRTLALVYIEPPAPELLHGLHYASDGDNAIQAVVRVGAGVAKERESRRASARLDSATTRLDIGDLLAERTLQRASRYLGTRIATSGDSADFILELTMRSFGIDARSTHATYLYTRAEAVLIDRRTGMEIWHEDVRGTDRLTPFVVGTRDVPSTVFSAATLHTVSVADFERALEQLTTYTSNLITNELREKLRDVRDR